MKSYLLKFVLLAVGLALLSFADAAGQSRGRTGSATTAPAMAEHNLPVLVAIEVARNNGWWFYAGKRKNPGSYRGNYDGCGISADLLLYPGAPAPRPPFFARQPAPDCYYHLFQGKDLKAGWTLKSVQIGGTYAWSQGGEPRLGTRNAGFVVKIDCCKAGARRITQVKLEGPANRDWQEAFQGN